MGALSAARSGSSSLPLRQPGNRVRLRVRVPAEVLEATEQGLAGLDDEHRRTLGQDAPPPVTF
ncbi:hypothetical protein GXP71_19425 [Cellulomonas sp. H30R-01]|uniref:hypothetical protein n=1 Tax=Cellulomonas sp. H30R-01 TaxID=2704467 RepID=UPI00138D2487|nr:hypothetical protein [Cellulomonas sp. H30R-01]QHT58038.1 hypothetical protein GXP71_19425 [Cellulomonas sp. H30R-01]